MKSIFHPSIRRKILCLRYIYMYRLTPTMQAFKNTYLETVFTFKNTLLFETRFLNKRRYRSRSVLCTVMFDNNCSIYYYFIREISSLFNLDYLKLAQLDSTFNIKGQVVLTLTAAYLSPVPLLVPVGNCSKTV